MGFRRAYMAGWLALLLALVSCAKDDHFTRGVEGGSSDARTSPTRSETKPNRQVLILVSAGVNSLRTELKADQLELAGNALPVGTEPDAHVLLVLSQFDDYQVVLDTFTNKNTSKLVRQQPVLYRMYAAPTGEVVRDTVMRWEQSASLCDPAVFQDALGQVYHHYPAKGYGMIFSSHATGWLPEGYYFNPALVDPQYNPASSGPRKMPAWNGAWAELFPPLEVEGEPAVKSIGQDDQSTGSLEMDLDAFADALPFHLDYLLFDACLCGCVEVAHALRDKVDLLGFSPTEVLSNGLDYTTLSGHLLRNSPDPIAVCRDYFDYYDRQSGVMRSATIALLDLRQMDALEQVCKDLFARYREPLSQLDGTNVQGYFRANRHFFYDLKDILVKAGITAEEQAQLDQALSQCVLYKAATDWFMQDGRYGFPIRTFSGMSMYLPSMGTDMLDQYYKAHISWNQATGLVQ